MRDSPARLVLEEPWDVVRPWHTVAVRVHGKAFVLGKTSSPGLAEAWQAAADRLARTYERESPRVPSEELMQGVATAARVAAELLCQEGAPYAGGGA
jgi:hypothetical protein